MQSVAMILNSLSQKPKEEDEKSKEIKKDTSKKSNNSELTVQGKNANKPAPDINQVAQVHNTSDIRSSLVKSFGSILHETADNIDDPFVCKGSETKHSDKMVRYQTFSLVPLLLISSNFVRCLL